MKSLLKIVLILGVFCIFAKCAEEVGPIACTGVVSGPETDDFIPRESWVSDGKNFSIWEHSFNFFTSNAPYKVYDMLVEGAPFQNNTNLVQIWELVPVPGHSGYYHFPAWRNMEYVGVAGGQSHNFGYIVSSQSSFAYFMSFRVVNYTCTPGFQLFV